MIMVIGNCVSEDDKLIEWVSEFPYLVSLIADNGKIDVKVEKRIASASKAFEAMSMVSSKILTYH